jgi:hypothetical protein
MEKFNLKDATILAQDIIYQKAKQNFYKQKLKNVERRLSKSEGNLIHLVSLQDSHQQQFFTYDDLIRINQ